MMLGNFLGSGPKFHRASRSLAKTGWILVRLDSSRCDSGVVDLYFLSVGDLYGLSRRPMADAMS